MNHDTSEPVNTIMGLQHFAMEEYFITFRKRQFLGEISLNPFLDQPQYTALVNYKKIKRIETTVPGLHFSQVLLRVLQSR